MLNETNNLQGFISILLVSLDLKSKHDYVTVAILYVGFKEKNIYIELSHDLSKKEKNCCNNIPKCNKALYNLWQTNITF